MIGNALKKFKRSDQDAPENIIQFCQSRWGLNQTLFPTQIFFLKLAYGIPLDRSNRTIELKDNYAERVIDTLTEWDYLQHLYREKRCNWSDERVGTECHELVLVMGRRASKSKMTSMITSYEFRNLLRHYCPQEYFQLPDTDEIYITNVASSKDQALKLFNSISNYSAKSDVLKPFLYKDTLKSLIRFRTQYDIDNRESDFSGTIIGQIGGSNSRSIRGSGSIIVALDELAYFIQNDGKASDNAVYDALTPSIAAFTHPDGTPAGKVVSLSSPAGKSGKLYDLYMYALDPENSDEDILMIQAPTWEINPRISSDYLRSKYKKDPTAYMNEFGAQFSDQVRAWIDDADHFDQCVWDKPEEGRYWNIQFQGKPRTQHFLGLDLGYAKGDGCGLSIVHQERSGKIFLDYHALYMANRGEDQHPQYRNLPDRYERTQKLIAEPYQRLGDIADEIKELSKYFSIRAGCIDQYTGPAFLSELWDRGLRQIEKIDFTESLNHQVYLALKSAYRDHALVLYNDPLLLWELKQLQAETRRKHIIIVEAPKVKGMHDDLSDSLARAVWLSQKYAMEHPQGYVLAPGQRSADASVLLQISGGQSVDVSSMRKTRVRNAQRERAIKRGMRF